MKAMAKPRISVPNMPPSQIGSVMSELASVQNHDDAATATVTTNSVRLFTTTSSTVTRPVSTGPGGAALLYMLVELARPSWCPGVA